ncbi:hypothetical protein GCM10008941_01940 [Rhizomicrobium palustre]
MQKLLTASNNGNGAGGALSSLARAGAELKTAAAANHKRRSFMAHSREVSHHALFAGLAMNCQYYIAAAFGGLGWQTVTSSGK